MGAIKNKIRFSIRWKILLGFAAVILLLAFSIVTMIGRMNVLEKEMNFIAEHDMQVHELTNLIEKNMIDMETGQRGYVITGDANYLEPYNNGQKQWKENYDRLFQLVADNPKQQQKLTEIRADIEQWISVAGEPIIQLRKENKMQDIVQFFKDDPGKKHMDHMREQFSTFRNTEMELTKSRTAALAANNKRLKIELSGLLVFATLIATVMAVTVSGRITRNVKQVVHTITEIASSGGDLTRRIEVKTSDEIRDLGRATNLLLSSLRDMMAGIKDSAIHLKDAAQVLNQGAEENNKISQEVTAAIQKVAQGAEEQVAQTEEISAVMEQTMAGLQQAATSTSDVAELAKTTMNIADEGGRTISETLKDIETLEASFDSIQSGIAGIAEKSEQVQSTIGYISQISSQTNLLALNAAIEAARAGEHGKGFAVVAGEIRKLADQAARSAEEINETITSMTESIGSLVRLVKTNAQNIYGGIRSLRGAGDSFQTIVSQVNGLSSQIIEVAATIEQMSAGSQSVVESIQEISKITEDAASATQEVAAMTEQQTASIREMADASARVNGMAETLEQLVNKFKI